MRHTAELLETDAHRAAAELIVDDLPPAGSYETTYQPDYPDRGELTDATYELLHTTPVTRPRLVDAHQQRLTALATGEIRSRLATTGGCAEDVDASVSIEVLAERDHARREVVSDSLGEDTIDEGRVAGQAIKPRSRQLQTVNSRSVYSFMGEGINGKKVNQRTPDPSRLVAAAVQSRDLAEKIRQDAGYHPAKAHEALSLPYERAFMRIDPETNGLYLLSTDKPWIGKRTNGPDSQHLEMLSLVRNPVGVKIGSDSDATHIATLEKALNPDAIPGRVTYMIRVGEDLESMRRILGAIKSHTADPLIQYDIHGSTTTEGTYKVRYTGNVIRHAQMLAEECGRIGLTMHGVHLETTWDDGRLECTDEPGQLPTHEGNVDPGLNPRQLRYVLGELKPYMP